MHNAMCMHIKYMDGLNALHGLFICMYMGFDGIMCMHMALDTGWHRCMGCLIFVGRLFSAKEPYD